MMKKCTAEVPGYLTVYLALTLAVLLPFCLALIEGVRSNAVRMETECVMDIGLNSVLAEYHRELFRRYNLFAIDSSYGTVNASYENTKEHMQNYLERNFSMEDIFLSDYLYRDFLSISLDSLEMTGVSVLTDDGGAVFRKRAIEAVKDDLNVTLMQELAQWMQTVENNGFCDGHVEEQRREAQETLQSYDGKEVQIAENETKIVQVPNPVGELENVRNTGLLTWVIKDEEALSAKTLISDSLIIARMENGQVSAGNRKKTQAENAKNVNEDSLSFAEKFLFQEYLFRYMGYYGQPKEGSVLDYQVEYLLSGKDSDRKNLETVVTQICVIREAANAMYLFSDSEKCKQAEVVARLLATLVQVPELAEPLQITLLLGWAYAESLYDMKTIMAGGKVLLLKDDKSWHYSLENALVLADGNNQGAKGLGYKEYLRLLMAFANLEDLTKRAMNMVEADIRTTPGNGAFRLDGCYDWVEFEAKVKSCYGYEFTIRRGKEY